MRRILALLSVTVLTVAMLAMPASAQQQTGLVNINVQGVTVAVPIGIAANICPNLSANVLAQNARTGQTAQCAADADAIANLPGPFPQNP